MLQHIQLIYRVMFLIQKLATSTSNETCKKVQPLRSVASELDDNEAFLEEAAIDEVSTILYKG